ncbi:conserved Plasmodium protein, unknown function [Plasmodium relictum]|uniref:Uncharacterized protein n=1 Tax=Plasmodium relictum TaxID=85471 RepID=A0A1J1HAJ1_PLARL|nr:conserved Plasmodium protein, unknown function [Plasmodium relictum]CRH02444.1 conserved Plasmodium protein, unknown function [Plasmodium relictum]
MENTVKKKANEQKRKKKTNDIKDKLLSGKAVLCFDEEIEFDKCDSITEDIVDKKIKNEKKNIIKDNKDLLEEIGSKQTKSLKQNEKSKVENIDKIAKDREKSKKKSHDKDNNNNKIDDNENNNKNKSKKKSNNDDEIKIHKKEEGNINMENEAYLKYDLLPPLDSSTNSSVSPRIIKSTNELKKKNSTKILKIQSNSNDLIEENNEELNKWIEFLPNINLEIENILNNPLPCYNILNNIKRIKKIKSIVYNENENDEILNSIEKSNLMFNSIKLSTKEQYIIRFLCEGSYHNLSDLVELLYYVLNKDELTLDKLPIKIVSNITSNISNQSFLIGGTLIEKETTNEENNLSKDYSFNKDMGNKETLTDNNLNMKNNSNNNSNNFSLDNFSDEECYSDEEENEKKNFNIPISKEDLFSSIPILLSRKNLGDNMKKMNISKNENNEKECLWVWENDNYDLFPSYYKEVFKYFKELRSNMSKIYKTLIKLKNCIISKDLQNIIKLYDSLNELKKKQFLESEKRCKKILIEKKKIIKKKMEIKKQEEKKKKIEEIKYVEEKKNSTIVKLDSTIQVKTEEKKAKQQNLILSWLTLKKSHTVNTLHTNDNTDQNLKYPIVNVINFNESSKEKLLEAQNQLPIFKCYRNDNALNDVFKNISSFDKQELLMNYIKLCESHKKVVVDYFKVYVDNREFFEEIPSVDSVDGSKIILQNESSVRSKLWEDNEFYLKLKNSNYIRSFFFYDNSWKRPFMSLLVHKILDDNINVLPFYYHDDMEYENDTNEDYYEKYETIDLTTENEENETESDGSSQDMFIVPDNEVNKDIDLTPITTPVSPDIYFFSIFNWDWNFEGNQKHNYNIIDKNVLKEFNLKYKENIYGCQYISWGNDNNPFKYMSERKNLKNTLDNYDIKKLIKHSHGKITKKDILVDQFKTKNEHLTKADTERKFKIYLVYKKCEDNRKKWMASEEGVKLFKNEKLLAKIYEIRKRKLNFISRKIEEVKRQKKMHKENLKKEEKIKKKEKTNQEKLENKESMKKDVNLKDAEKLEKIEILSKDDILNENKSPKSALTIKKKIEK